ncbi:Inositol-phosphate phosphatase [Rickettsiales endosymbiont of Paramecium tredecaurelia]|uniref:hypothetical protein n=1 Tax=Candidatus Sarmatiella mevalonica TaxID=2770581 RepID=UPI0019215AB0|nr:hypothetical protein [Candidatus Sarmatiella mevalonica]MBL3284748.1 Inositol-phosphate phosphatase [Candidatus Sarmatiella mevalonica]
MKNSNNRHKHNLHNRFNINDATLHRFILETRNVARGLKRDWFELESMQSATSASSKGFLQRAIIKAYQDLAQALAEDVVLASELPNVSTHSLGDSFLIIEPLDSPTNFARALPFFALSVSKVIRSEAMINNDHTINNFELVATHSLFYLPILDEIYYTSIGKGVAMEKLGMRSEAVKLTLHNNKREEGLIYSAVYDTHGSNNPNVDPDVIPKTRNIINCLSPMYHLSLLLKSQIDLIEHYSDNENCYFQIAAKLFAKEAGAVYKNSNNIFRIANIDSYFP